MKYALSFLVVSFALSASAGPKIVGNGGDAALIRRKVLERRRPELTRQIEALFNGTSPYANLRSVLSYMAGPEVHLQDPAADQLLQRMKREGLGADIAASPFELRASCLDEKGVARTASALNGKPKSAICIDAGRLVSEFGPYIQDSDVIALLMHEFAHHFGAADTDHSFAAAVADEYQRDSERRNLDGDPLNYFTR